MQGMIKDDMSLVTLHKQHIINTEDQNLLALTPQIISSQSNKRANNLLN
jgi:hypothetical protein